jgi:hypothetical protein
MSTKDKLVLLKPLNASPEHLNLIKHKNNRIFRKQQSDYIKNIQLDLQLRRNEGKLKREYSVKLKKHTFLKDKECIVRFEEKDPKKDWLEINNVIYFISHNITEVATLEKIHKLFPYDDTLLRIKYNNRIYATQSVWTLNKNLRDATYNEKASTYSGHKCINIDNVQDSILKYYTHLNNVLINTGHKPEIKEPPIFKRGHERNFLKRKRRNYREKITLQNKIELQKLILRSKEESLNDYKICLKHRTTKEVVRIWNSERYTHDSIYSSKDWHPTSKTEWKALNKNNKPSIKLSKLNIKHINKRIDKSIIDMEKVEVIKSKFPRKKRWFDYLEQSYKKKHPKIEPSVKTKKVYPDKIKLGKYRTEEYIKQKNKDAEERRESSCRKSK